MNEIDTAILTAPASGIIWAYRFAADGSARLVPPDTLDAALGEDDGWVWVHLGLADKRCRDWISQTRSVSAIGRELLLDADEHLRLDMIGDEIVGIIPDLQQELSKEVDDIVRIHFVMSPRLLITARRKPVHSIEAQRRAIEAGRLFPTAISFFDAVIDHFADTIGHLAERTGDDLDIVERHVLSDEPGDERQMLGRVRIKSVRMRRHLSQLRSLFHRLERRIETENKPFAVALRSLSQKLDTLDHETGSLYERARLLQDEVAAKMAAIGNRRLFVLSVLTATLLPPTLITGFFGMNTKDLPFQNTDGGTWYAAAIAFGAGIVTYKILKRLQAL